MSLQGDYSEGIPWELKRDGAVDVCYLGEPCKHAIFLSETPQKRSDGTVYRTEKLYRVPMLAVAYNEAGCNQTAICVECIIEATKA